MTPEMFFDYLSVRLDRAKGGNATARINVDFVKDAGKYLLELENGLLNQTADVQADDAERSHIYA